LHIQKSTPEQETKLFAHSKKKLLSKSPNCTHIQKRRLLNKRMFT